MGKKLKIAMLGHKAFPSRDGGVEVVVKELSTRMAETCKVTSYVRRWDAEDGAEVRSEGKHRFYKGVRIIKVPCMRKRGLEAMTSSFTAAARAAGGRYDVVHFHAEGPCAMLWLPKMFGKRCVATIHGLDWQRSKWAGGLGKVYIKMGEKCAAKMADEIIVLSREAQNYFRETYGRETVLIPNGISRPEKKEAQYITETYDLKGQDYFLYLGRIVPEKRPELLIKAFKKLDTDKKLVIAGGSSDTDEYYAQIKELAAGDSRIIFTGFVSGRPLEELYSNAYAYVLPSDLEGMPMSLLEAMSYGCACVTSDIPECADVMDGHGFTFAKGNEEALTELLQDIDRDPEKVRNIAESASDFICGKYNWDDITEQTMALYQKEK